MVNSVAKMTLPTVCQRSKTPLPTGFQRGCQRPVYGVPTPANGGVLQPPIYPRTVGRYGTASLRLATALQRD